MKHPRRSGRCTRPSGRVVAGISVHATPGPREPRGMHRSGRISVHATPGPRGPRGMHRSGRISVHATPGPRGPRGMHNIAEDGGEKWAMLSEGCIPGGVGGARGHPDGPCFRRSLWGVRRIYGFAAQNEQTGTGTFIRRRRIRSYTIHPGRGCPALRAIRTGVRILPASLSSNPCAAS